nr:MAG TPA: tail tape measure protein [Caudoviricetes sp.]
MAGGNLGDLWFQLGVKDNTSKELQKIIDKLKTGDDAANSLLRALQGFGTKKSGFKEQAEKAKEFADVLNEINRRISKLKKNDKSDEAKDLQMAVKNALSYLDMLQRINIERSKISELRSLNPNVDTSKLKEAELMLENVNNQLYRLQNKAQGGGGGGVDYANVLQDYAKVLQMTFRDVKQITDQFKKEIAEKAGISPFFKNDQGLKNIKAEIDTLLTRLGKVREDITLYQHAIGTGTKEGVSFGQQGLKEANAEAEKLMGTITALQNVYDTLRVSQANVKDLIGQTPQKQRQDDIQKRMSDYYSKLEKDSAKQEAQAVRDAAKAKREDIAVEKQRQAEIKNAERRYDSLGNKVRQLRSEYSRGISIGADVSKAEGEINRLLALMRTLRDIRGELYSGNWKNSLGTLGNMGSGHDTTLASRVLQDQRAVNQEVQRGVELERKRQQEIAQTAAKVQSDLVRGFEKANSHAGKLNSTVQDLKSLFLQGGLVFSAQQFAMSIITTGGEMEKQHIALQSILGDMQNANTMFNQIKELALNSPFTFSELNRDVKQLAAYGVEYDQLYDTTKRLADMSSGLGVSFDRIALAFGQVQARGWLDGKELRQIAYAGIPLLEKLSEFYSKQEGRNVSTSEIKTRISNREVSFDDVKSIFWQMTDAGGQFYNMQQVLSETLLGRYNKLKDAWEIMLAEFASGNSLVGGFFKTALDGATALVQALHTLAPLFAAAFSGYALTKLSRMAGGNAGSAYLSTKGKLAVDAAAKIAEGKQLNSVERQVLATKNQITGADLRNLIANKAINKVEIQRLLVAGKISTKQYQIYAALLRQQGAATSLNTKTVTYGLSWMRVGVSAKLALNGIATAASSMWAAIGGLPGLIVTGATMLIAKLWGYYTELTSAIKQTNEELVDRQKQMNEFRGSNDIKSIISGGDSKEIDNAISAYEEKLKELAPYEADLFIMSANERASHEERLKYLEEQLKLMQEANKVVQSKLADRDNYSDLQDLFDSARRKAEQYTLAKDKLMSFVPDKTESDTNNFLDKKNLERWVNNSMQQLDSASRKISEKISEMYKGIKAPKAEIESMQKQTIDSFVSGLSLPEEQMKDLRLSIYKGLGLLNGALKSELGQKLAESVSNSMPEVANAIRSGRELDEASKNKVKEIAKKCIEQMKTEYPGFANELQGLLNASNFQAVIKLVYSSDSFKKFTEAEQSLYDQYIPAPERTGSGKKDKRFSDFLNSIGGIGKNSNEKDLNDAAYQKLQKLWEVAEAAKVGKYTKEVKDKRMKAYLAQKSLTEEILGIKFVPSYNKSNKPYKPGKNKGKQEDEQLKRLQERLSSLKSARQMYQKYKSIMPDEEAKKKTYNLFPEVTGLNLDDYQKAIHSLLDGFKINTTERKKFQTSIYREVAEWLFDEKDKKEYERKAADFTELLNRLSSQWDLYKELFSKTGDKNFSSAAFNNPGYIDDKAKELIAEYNNKFGKDFQRENAMSMSDGVAKETLKGPGEYEAWKKIVDLLRNNYIKILQDAADIIEKTEDYEDKILKIRERYNELISKTNDPGIKARYEIQRDKEIGKVKLDKFKNSSDYLNFYGAIVSLGMYKAQTIGAKIRQNINEALQSGAIDAREYAKEIKQLDEQLSKLEKLRPSFLNGGFEGIVNAKKERANEMITLGSSQYNKAKEDLNKAKINGDLGGMAAAANSKAAGEKMMEGGEKLLKGASKMSSTISMIDTIIHGINDIVQGANDTFQDIKSTASALGVDTESDGWTDANSFFEGFSSSSASATKAWESLKSGNVGGVVSGVVGSFTGWIKAFSAGHDAKLDRQIKLAERQLNELKDLSSNINTVIEKTLGGIYYYNRSSDATKKLNDVKNDFKAWDAFSKTYMGKAFFGGKNLSHYSKETYDAVMKTETNPSVYADQLALLHAQEDELRKQRQAEDDKKKTDNDKLADYDQQIKEMELQIKTFAQDFLKDVYSIDMKSWGNQLTDTVVSAWTKGEDAVEAYKNKVKEMVREVTKNIVSQKIMEKALEKPLEWLTGILDKKGKLDETDMGDFADKLYQVGENVVPQLTGIFDALKKKGLDLRENGSSSLTNSIKGINEEEIGLLASYLNSIRLYCAEDNENLKQLTELTKSALPEISVIAKSQLVAMNQLVTLAEYRNGKLDDMYSWMRSITKETGVKSLRIS